MGKLLRTAVIGYGYWGKNLARVVNESDDFQLVSICDPKGEPLAVAQKLYSNIDVFNSYDQITDEIDLAIIATPASTHFELAKTFLQKGKHVLITKPFASSIDETDELLRVSEQENRVVFVDHTFVFHPAVRKMKEMLPKIGRPYFVLSQRLNLGLYQDDVNVITDLMPHDLSIISFLLDREVRSAKTFAIAAAGLPQEDLAHTNIDLGDGIHGLLTSSWLSPFKVRQLFVVGSDGMLCYDDNQVMDKVKFFDRGVSLKELTSPQKDSAYTARINYRSGDLHSPAISNEEALKFELDELKKAIYQPEVRQKYNRLNRQVMVGLKKIYDGIGE